MFSQNYDESLTPKTIHVGGSYLANSEKFIRHWILMKDLRNSRNEHQGNMICMKRNVVNSEPIRLFDFSKVSAWYVNYLYNHQFARQKCTGLRRFLCHFGILVPSLDLGVFATTIGLATITWEGWPPYWGNIAHLCSEPRCALPTRSCHKPAPSTSQSDWQ